ncbi:glycoside hydrolase family 53 protein [Flavihumibacter petaseus]|uniref:Arabinogalactan endo-beta-1,4-galactanase n=1 Tax=Flavihumibacter petaseus NBRC 106054 TaxID=1220578 RepID=A0A0E9MUB1_9BACT|nr:glycosyl hydrolase 53 family protein [Flavihumibacter petaseus]GAO41001.1 putative endo-1,4-beta-galactosidase [Flavihumibacter petaseus NBRC 106054]
MIRIQSSILWKAAVALCIVMSACSKSSDPDPDPVPPDPPVTVSIKGADISWVTEMEAAGKKFYTAGGQEKECFALMQSLGFNTIRLRVWVNPADNYNSVADVVAKAKRAQALGLQVMIDFHYSDTWADPGHQEKPATWATLTFGELKAAVAQHTQSVLQQLKSEGVTVQWVQAGNETNDGMLWPDGKASEHMDNYAALITAAFDAAKSVYPSAKVIVHVSNGWDNDLFRWNIGGLAAAGAKFDIVGLSMYPGYAPSGWAAANTACLAIMNDIVTRYNKGVMVVEAGMPWDDAATSKAFLDDLIRKTASVKDDRGLGVFYWEPEAYGGWKGYTLGAFDNTGKPTIALDPFKN